MENKMKWDRSKKKKFPSIEIEMSNTHYNDNNTRTAEEETSVTMFPMWSSKQNTNSPSPVRGFKEHNFVLHSGDSGIESVQVCNYCSYLYSILHRNLYLNSCTPIKLHEVISQLYSVIITFFYVCVWMHIRNTCIDFHKNILVIFNFFLLSSIVIINVEILSSVSKYY